MNKVKSLFGIKYPIIQGGMVWNSGWQLVSAVSNAGGLGLLGAGSMYPDELVENINKCKLNTNKPFGVNLPLIYPSIEEHIENIIKHKIKIVFTSAGSPSKWTKELQSHGIKIAHVVSSLKFAEKAQSAGVDAIVAEGFEAGGHNGREETTTLCLVPNIAKSIKIPLIAAGGIATGKQMLACMILGADGVQIGSRFAATHEASSHQLFKQQIVNAQEGDTQLTLKQIAPVRLWKNEFWEKVNIAQENGATKDELVQLLGKGRTKKGMLEGDLINGEIEFGQCSSLINDIKSAEEVIQELMNDYNIAQKGIMNL